MRVGGYLREELEYHGGRGGMDIVVPQPGQPS